MARGPRWWGVLVGLIGLALVALVLVLHPDLELLFMILAVVLVVALFANALGLTRPRI